MLTPPIQSFCWRNTGMVPYEKGGKICLNLKLFPYWRMHSMARANLKKSKHFYLIKNSFWNCLLGMYFDAVVVEVFFRLALVILWDSNPDWRNYFWKPSILFEIESADVWDPLTLKWRSFGLIMPNKKLSHILVRYGSYYV